MGIYVFNRDVLVECLENDLVDFGKHIIPQAIQERQVSAYIFDGYWEDIGTIRAFYEANLDLTDLLPQYSFFEASAPIYTHPRFLPGSKINGATLRQAIIADGCIISDAHLERSVIGVRSIIQTGATIRNSIVMGADYYETDPSSAERGLPPIGIGRNCVIDRAIIDKNARIADGVVITPEGKAGGLGCGQLFHPRRDRRRAEERGDSGRVSGFSLASVYTAAYSAPAGGTFSLPFLCSFQGRAVSRVAAGSAISGGGSLGAGGQRGRCANKQCDSDEFETGRVRNSCQHK